MNGKRKMLLTFAMSIMVGLAGATGVPSARFKMKNVSVAEAISQIWKKSGYSFVYESRDLNTQRRITVDADNIQEAVSQILEGQPVVYEIKDKTIILHHTITRPKVTKADRVNQKSERQVTGRVVDEQGNPIIGATIRVKGRSGGAITDIDGNFQIDAADDDEIEVSYVGYTSLTQRISGNTMNIVLHEDSKLINEVVVIGYGTAKRSDLTGSLSSVSEKSFRDQNVTSLSDVLQGRAAGVQISNTIGAPGGETRIRVRGSNSILGDNNPLFVIDGFVGADFSLLNPNDIQSIEVLKDASSTAIYGSRGANGVILVTTKNAQNDQKVRVSYSGNVSVSNQLKKYDLMSAGDFAKTVNQHDDAFGVTHTFTDEQVRKYEQEGGFDYQDAILRTAVSTQQQLSVSGGSKSTQFRISGNYLNHQGILRESSYERFTMRTNLSTKVNDRLSLRFQVNAASSRGRNNMSRTGAGNPIVQMLSWAPTTNPYDGYDGYTLSDPVGSIKTNPLSLIYDQDNRFGRINVNMLGGLTYKIVNGLTFDFQAIGDWTVFNNKSWSGTYVSNNNPSASKTTNLSKMYQTTANLTYDKTFGIHHITATAVVETQQFRWENLTGSASGLKFPELKYDNLAQASSTAVNSDFSAWQLLSYLGRINYAIKDRYLLSVSLRSDGSSKFAKAHRFSTFPAMALAWNASEEKFIKDLNIFSKLKLRASWGKTGSQAISPYATLSGYNTGIYYAYDTGGRTNGIQMGNPGNLDLKWETTTQTDFGLEMGFLKGRLSIELDYFHKLTDNLLLNKSVPYYLGGGNITSNVGKVKNDGIDLNINAYIIQSKDWMWNTNLNYSYVKNEVTDLGKETQIFDNADISGWNGQPEFVYAVGHSLGSLWGLKYLGPWQKGQETEAALNGCKVGDAHYEDLNNDHAIDGSDYQIIGVGIPKHTLGWNNTVSYKNLSLNAFFQGVFGIQKLDYTRCMSICAQRDARYATITDAHDRYIPGINESAWIPAWSPTSLWVPASTLFLENASYLRLKNLGIGYSFKVPHIGDFKVEASVTNLFTITSYKGNDPEASNVGGGGSDVRQGVDYGAYPNSRTYTMSLSINF